MKVKVFSLTFTIQEWLHFHFQTFLCKLYLLHELKKKLKHFSLNSTFATFDESFVIS